MEGFEYIAELKDGMSKPAWDAKAALEGLKTQIRATEKEIRALQDRQLQYRERGGNWKGIASQVGTEIAKLRLHLGDLRTSESQLAWASGGSSGWARKLGMHMLGASSIGYLLADAVRSVGRAIYQTSKEVVEFAIDAAEAKANAIVAFNAMGESGQDMFRSLSSLARNIHAPVERAVALAQELMAMGMERTDHIQATIAAVTALERTGLSSGAAKVQRVIEESLAEGHLKLPKKLAGTGLNLDTLTADLAKRLGQPIALIKQQLKDGKIAADVGIAAIVDSINTGKIGQIAAQKLTLGDVATDFKNDFKAMFEDVNLGPLMDGLRDFISIFDAGSASGKTMKATFTDVINTIIRWIGKGIEQFTIFVLEVEIGALTAEIKLAPIVKGLMAVEHWMEKIADRTTNGLAKLTDWLTIPVLGGEPIGKDIAGGIANGIQGGAPGIKAAAGSASAQAISGAQESIGAFSPARKLMPVGRSASEGFALGIEQSGAAEHAMTRMVQPPNIASAGASSSSRAGATVNVDMGGIHVHAEHAGNVEEWMPIVESKIVDVFERMALELGG
jgi:hypothetical protein